MIAQIGRPSITGLSKKRIGEARYHQQYRLSKIDEAAKDGFVTALQELRRLNIWIAERKAEIGPHRLARGRDRRYYRKQPRLQRLIAQAQGYADSFAEILEARGSL